MFKNIDSDQFSDLIRFSKPLILDVRTAYEFAEGHIENALLIPHNELGARMQELLPYKERDIIIYCHAGLRSMAAANYLLSQGFTSLYNLQHGIIEWEITGKDLVA